MAVILEFIWFVKIFYEGNVFFRSEFRRLLMILLLLTFSPDHVHNVIDNRMISGFGSYTILHDIINMS